MNDYFIFGGCSFTGMHNSWARQLSHKINPNRCDIAARAGAGNTFIANNVLHHAFIAKINHYVPNITIMWSHPSRFDFPLHPKESPHYKKIFFKNETYKQDFNPTYYDENNWWLLGCGNGHIDFTRSDNEAINDEYVKGFAEYHKMFWNSTYQWLNTLQSILLVQSVCEANNWPYRFTVYNNFMKTYNVCSDSVLALNKFINWEKFTFTDDNYGGLREHTLQNLNTWDDGYDMHPSYEAHTDFLDNFWLPIHLNEYNKNTY
jgi:hypothetical protein